MLLFDDVVRYDPSPADHLESHFPFINRVATPYWAEVRRVLELWFAHLPASECADLRARFRSSDDRQHVAAFWELYLYELFTRLGFAVRLHPPLTHQSTNPDMLVERKGDSFYVEAVALTDKETEFQSSRRSGQIFDAINQRVQSANFFLDVETVSLGNGTPPLSQIGRFVDRWLASLDPDAVPQYAASNTDWDLPKRDATFGDWQFRFRAIPKRSDRRVVEGPTVGKFGPPKAVWVNDHDDLKDRLGRKSRKYGELDRPLVIALLYERWTAATHHLTRALFGWGWGYPHLFRTGRLDPTWPLEADGSWVNRDGPLNRFCSAILCGLHTAPHSVVRCPLELWHHPWARHPLTADLPFAATRIGSVRDEVVETAETASVSELFNLPEEWPPGVPFPNGRHHAQRNVKVGA